MMRTPFPLVALLLAAGVLHPAALLAQAPPPETADVCFPESFSVRQVTYQSSDADHAVSRIWFSTLQNAERTDLALSATQTLALYVDYDAQIRTVVQTEVDPATGESTVQSCSQTPINAPLSPFCLVREATLRESFSGDGGLVPQENYVLYDPNNPARILFDVTVVRVGSEILPTRLFERLPAGTVLHEFWDLSLEDPDPAIFELPPECAAAP